MSQYSVSAQAYFKIIFHAAKHPHSSVNGVLLGKEEPAGQIRIMDAVPLLHHWTSLSPMMEIGLDLAARHAESLGLNLVGYYQACERADDTALAPVGERVAGKLKDGFKNAVALVIDGEKLGSGEVALIPYVSQGATWRPYSGDAPAFSAGSVFQLASPDLPKRAVTLVREQDRHQVFGDFDDHLEDVTIEATATTALAPFTMLYLGPLLVTKLVAANPGRYLIHGTLTKELGGAAGAYLFCMRSALATGQGFMIDNGGSLV
ncbi:hypothetical protein C8R47DRAFT_1324028 [Mycena vitilis]|nr:hypothetical protein C8R47DRAFT_1324028 [Mycena vitilis]